MFPQSEGENKFELSFIRPFQKVFLSALFFTSDCGVIHKKGFRATIQFSEKNQPFPKKMGTIVDKIIACATVR